MNRDDKTIPTQVQVNFVDAKDLPELSVYAFHGKGTLLDTKPLEKNTLSLDLPASLNGQHIELVVAPRPDNDKDIPSLASLKKLGGFSLRKRFLLEKPSLELIIPPYDFRRWCWCLVRGRLIKRFTLPDGTVTERPVCNSRVHICEVDTWRILLPKIPDLDIYRLRDDLLDKLRVIPQPTPPLPIPPRPLFEEGIPPLPSSSVPVAAGIRSAGSKSIAADLNPIELLSNEHKQAVYSLARSDSIAQIKQSLIDLELVIRPYLCQLKYIWRYYVAHCITLTNVDSEGRFSAFIRHRCSDQPDIYIWVEQLIGGVWQTLYRPSYACGTRWNYICGSEIVINLPDAVACEQPSYEVPDDVGLFVLPWAIGDTPIWGKPGVSAPFGWLRSSGFVNYHTGSSLGILTNAPFGGVLNFRQDDSYFIPTDAVKYYRYSYRKHSAAPNTGATDSSWTAMSTPQARIYRMEYSGQLPTYESYPVGPFLVGAHNNLFEFKPQVPPVRATDPATVVAREWISGPVNDIAASWNTLLTAPPLSADNSGDDAGPYQVKIEVFDKDGVQVAPGGAFHFLCLNADQATTRMTTLAEIAGNAYVMDVQVDNNNVSSALPQPSINGVGASDNCGFLRYQPGEQVRIAFQAEHPNDRAVFRFGVTRGSNGLAVASTAAPYIETSSAVAAPYVKVAGVYAHEFDPSTLVGTCVNAAFAAHLNVYGKATNGYHRIGYDQSRLIAFALAVDSEEDD